MDNGLDMKVTTGKLNNLISKVLSTLIEPDHLYILMDWFASGVSFLTMFALYRFAPNIDALGNGSWLLNVFATSLFVSAASQYYSMFRKTKALETVVAFMPILILEGIVLFLMMDFKYFVVIFPAVFLNAFFAAFRGSLFGQGRMVLGAFLNMVEQVLRFAFFLGLVKLSFSLEMSILLNNLLAYIITTSMVFIFFYRELKPKTLSIKFDRSIILYSIVFVMINLIMSGDMLLLKGTTWMGSFALIKPWGQIIIVVSTPFINIILKKYLHKEPMGFVLTLFAVTMGIYAIINIGFGDKISNLVFGYSIESRWFIASVILEHLLISIGIIIVYKMLLDEVINIKFIISFVLMVILFVINIKVFMWVSPFVIYPLGLALMLLVNRKLLLRDEYGS